MSQTKTKGKSALGIVLALSLDIGKSGKVKTGTWEAGYSGTGQSESVQGLKKDYDALVQHLKTIDTGLSTVPVSRAKPLQTRREVLAEAMKTLENRVVNNVESERDHMRNDIATQTKAAEAVIVAIGQAVDLGEKPIPTITYTAPTGVTTQTEITLSSLNAAAQPAAPLTLVRGTEKTALVRFGKPGEGQKFRIDAAETDTHQAGSVTVTVAVGLPRRTITWTPPKEIVWGTALTLKTLGATATGEGDGLVLDPPDGILAVGEAVPLTITAPGAGGKWLEGTATASVKVTLAPRSIDWILPPKLPVTQKVTPEFLKASVSAGAGAFTVTAPAGGNFVAVGQGQPVTIVVAATKTHAAVSKSGTVEAVKAVPKLTWAAPKPVVVGTSLSATQLNAKIAPDSLKTSLVYDPADGTDLPTAGTRFLRVRFAGDARHEAASADVRLLVATSEETKRGSEAMRDGSAWTKPTSGKAAQRVKEWKDDDGSDPNSLKMMGQQLMREIGTMTPEELNAHLDALQKTTPGSARTAQGGTYPNTIWTFGNGLQIRYKSNGDMHNPGEPMFCIEARTSEGPSAGGGDIAFKVTSEGVPAAKGPGDTKVPDDIGDPGDIAAFQSGAARTTHLFCRPKEKQVIVWNPPADVPAGTQMTAEQHLNAQVLGGAEKKFYRSDNTLVSVGNKLPPGSTQTLKVVVAATNRYEAGEATATIRVAAPLKK
ncbi:MAG: hypothetical protein ACREFY_06535 [Acetobacteraceae bacterium]